MTFSPLTALSQVIQGLHRALTWAQISTCALVREGQTITVEVISEK